MNAQAPGPSEPVPSSRPASLTPGEPWVRRAALIAVTIPLAATVALILTIHAVDKPAWQEDGANYLNNLGGGGGGGANGSEDTSTYGDGPTQGAYPTTYDPDDETSTDPGYGDGSGAPDTSSPTPTPSPSATGPAAVVIAYFAAITQRDYETAWSLGGENLRESYSSFVNGFADTDADVVSVTSVDGDEVNADLVATNEDGTTQDFVGTYTVEGGAITDFAVQQAP